MKHGTKPTREQRKLLKSWGLVVENWPIERDTPIETVIVHRISGQRKTIPKEVDAYADD